MSETTNTPTSSLAEYLRNIFDLNQDGKVTFKEVVHTILPNYAVGLVILVVDLLMLIAEYRVWDVGIRITGDPIKASGFVAISALPFYLSQLMWLYPKATKWQQGIAFLVGLGGLVTSAMFGMADLTQQYDVVAISRWIVYAFMAYVAALIAYALIDEGYRLHRIKVKARERAAFERDRLAVARSVLADIRESLSEERKLMEEFGPEAVQEHMALLRGAKDKGRANHKSPNPSTPPRLDN